MTNVLPFADAYAPVWTDPDTGIRKPMTAAAWRAAGFEVRELPIADSYVVDLDSRTRAIEGPPRDALPPTARPEEPHAG